MTYLVYVKAWSNARNISAQHLATFGFINGVDNVNWPPYRDSKS